MCTVWPLLLRWPSFGRSIPVTAGTVAGECWTVASIGSDKKHVLRRAIRAVLLWWSLALTHGHHSHSLIQQKSVLHTVTAHIHPTDDSFTHGHHLTLTQQMSALHTVTIFHSPNICQLYTRSPLTHTQQMSALHTVTTHSHPTHVSFTHVHYSHSPNRCQLYTRSPSQLLAHSQTQSAITSNTQTYYNKAYSTIDTQSWTLKQMKHESA